MGQSSPFIFVKFLTSNRRLSPGGATILTPKPNIIAKATPRPGCPKSDQGDQDEYHPDIGGIDLAH